MKTTRKPSFAKASTGRQNLLAVALVGALALTTTYAQTPPEKPSAQAAPTGDGSVLVAQT